MLSVACNTDGGLRVFKHLPCLLIRAFLLQTLPLQITQLQLLKPARVCPLGPNQDPMRLILPHKHCTYTRLPYHQNTFLIYSLYNVVGLVTCPQNNSCKDPRGHKNPVRRLHVEYIQCVSFAGSKVCGLNTTPPPPPPPYYWARTHDSIYSSLFVCVYSSAIHAWYKSAIFIILTYICILKSEVCIKNNQMFASVKIINPAQTHMIG